MAGVDYRYPGCAVNSLSDINLKMSLSSRIAVLGANGAGKTTLVKMIVGETRPSNLGKCFDGSSVFIHLLYAIIMSLFTHFLLNRNLQVQYSPESPSCLRRSTCLSSRRTTHREQPCLLHSVAFQGWIRQRKDGE